MLENIKSSYFCKNLFHHINDGVILNLIKYNKKLQNLTDISLTNYKYFSGKYIIYERTGKAKIYDALNDALL